MITASDIVDVLTENAENDLDSFVRGSGVLTPGLQVAKAFKERKEEAYRMLKQGAPNISSKVWFYVPAIKFGRCGYEVEYNIKTLRAYITARLDIPSNIRKTFDIYSNVLELEARNNIISDLDPENVRRAVDRLFSWSNRELKKWGDLAYISRTISKSSLDVLTEFQLQFPNFRLGDLASFDKLGNALSYFTDEEASTMAAWLRARAAQLGTNEVNTNEEAVCGLCGLRNKLVEESTEQEMDAFLVNSGVVVRPEDFVMDGHQIGSPGMWTGNYRYSIYYKRLLHKGKPVYLGSVMACHDYNRTGHAGAVNFYADVPTRTRIRDPRDRHGKRMYKNPIVRTSYGHGAVHMKNPGNSTHFSSLFDAAKFLLSLIKVQHPLKTAVEIGS